MSESSVARSAEHSKWLSALVDWFSKKGYRLIQEGKMPVSEWHEPDLFVLRDLMLERIVEVIVLDPYENGDRSVKEKIKKIKEYYNPPEIIIFEPVEYLDRKRLSTMIDDYTVIMGFKPGSYLDVEKFYAEKWKSQGLNVIFWNERDLGR